MICPICDGSGYLMRRRAGKLEWWHCACGGTGVLVQYEPPTIHCHTPRKKKSKRSVL